MSQLSPFMFIVIPPVSLSNSNIKYSYQFAKLHIHRDQMSYSLYWTGIQITYCDIQIVIFRLLNYKDIQIT